ncbi:hypothetical protein H8K35_01825 [Undibacterium sp. LX40W]|uniref:Uncharacterized protein n=1 Tax=Undibacterium nitidum TaxID=2762298 RepID=A0A923HK52_9BURK|nr:MULTISPECIES: hypothetical protein [Undibacterium]MBC3880879.1 hypothetical protein [Undibacterium nitidum]MBC3890388.1 hypothetical protein [Undibacterium sp. LX40W]
MGFDPLNLKDASVQFEQSMGRVIDERLAPLFDRSINHVSQELSSVIQEAGAQVDRNIALLSDEIHNQRSMTKDDIRSLIDYATLQLGSALDQRITTIKQETSELINQKVELLKSELNDAAALSRKTMLSNVLISIFAALFMAGIGLVYKQVSSGDLSLLSLFRVSLMSCATFTFVLSMLKFIQRWRNMNQSKKGVATIAIGYFGILKPNGAGVLLALSVCLVATCVAAYHFL